MDDIAPELLETMRKAFLKNLERDKQAQAILEAIASGRTNYADALDYAGRVGEALAKAFRENINGQMLPDGRMYYNIADRVLRPLLAQDHDLVADAAAKVQASLNQAAGLGLKAQAAPLDQDKVDGLVDKIAEAERFEDVYWATQEPVVTFSRGVVDDTIQANADFHFSVGLRPKITRRLVGGACKWCRSLAGVYDYPLPDREVYRRHERCRCTVEYDPGDGKRQNVHSKKWQTREIVESRQRRLDSNANTVQEYRPIKRGTQKNFDLGRNGTIDARKIDGYKGEVFVSDKAVIKPKSLHSINKNTEGALKEWGIPAESKPSIVIVSPEEMPNAFGRYDATKNIVFYVPEVADKSIAQEVGQVGNVERHEMWHKKQADLYRSSGKSITEDTYQDYLKSACETSKKALDSGGVTEYNVGEISKYAKKSYMLGRFDEVEAEWMVRKGR